MASKLRGRLAALRPAAASARAAAEAWTFGALELLGFALIGYSAWLVWAPVGYFVVGSLLIAIGQRAKRPRARDKERGR